MSRRVLCVRLDSAGDVLVTGPAIRAVAASSGEVVVLAGTGDVITVSSVRLGDDDLVRIARGLRR